MPLLPCRNYEVVFKLILREIEAPIAPWLNVELPEVRNTRVDLLGETATGDLIHIELQSTNDPDMPLRMAEYCLRVRRNCRKISATDRASHGQLRSGQ